MTASLFIPPRTVAVSAQSRVVAGAQRYFYLAGTATPATVYTSSAKSATRTQPVTATSGGEFPACYIDVAVKVSEYTANGVLRWTEDNIPPTGANESSIGDALFPRTDLEIDAAITPVSYLYPPGDVRRYGAIGDGATDDTSAVQNAISTGHNVVGENGKTYLCGPLTQSVDGQFIDFSGCSINLKAGSSSFQLLLEGSGARVIGGTFDGNKAAGHTTADAYYDHASVCVSADDCVVENITSQNSIGLAIKVIASSRVKIRNNTVNTYNVQGIFFDALSAAHEYDNEVTGNHVTFTASTGVGIYVSSGATYKNYRVKVTGNTIVGPAVSGSTEDICMTVNSEDCVISNNSTFGGDMGISASGVNQSVISGNRIDSPDATRSGYGIEVRGAYNSITGNYIKGGTYGIQINGTDGQNGNNISGNVVENSEDICIYISGSGAAARYCNITANTLKALVGVPSIAVQLTGDCKYALIANNQLIGPGSSEATGSAITLDSGTGYVRVLGNTLSGWGRGLTFYTAGAVAHTDVTFSHNDCSVDMGAESTWVAVDGLATIGARVVQMWNTGSGGLGTNYLDRSNGVLIKHGSSTPESSVTAGIGSIYLRTDGGTDSAMYTKCSGANTNSGWIAVDNV
jgi:hypothetical protein